MNGKPLVPLMRIRQSGWLITLLLEITESGVFTGISVGATPSPAMCARSNGILNGKKLRGAGLAEGGREGAKMALADFWRRISRSALLSPLQPSRHNWGFTRLGNTRRTD